ncbi:MAG: hypothetical protein HC851_14135 [Acaryochloris sp. RU_4_1]|nr:hypothetical protein [Acaryochloris sp. RU_4_1]NJR55530.1 hypothetical protein [Acaryochloris sp. CRU_2_0]
MKLWTLIVQPQVFFRRLAEQPINLWFPLGIVLSAGWLRYIALFLWIRHLPPILPAAVLQQLSVENNGKLLGFSIAVIGLLCWPLIGWGIYGGIIQLLTRCRGRAWQIAGWTHGSIALMGLILIGLAGLMPATGRVIPYTQFSALRPEEPWLSQYQTWLQIYHQVLREQAFLPITFWLILVGSLWSLWLLYWGLKAISPTKAALNTSILTLWVIIWRIL